jgi:hypothetical protein
LHSDSCDKFVGTDGRNYVWFIRGFSRILSRDSKEGPIIAMYVDEGTDKEVLWLTREAYEAGDLLFITLMTSESIGARRRFQAGLKKHVSTFGEPAVQTWAG